MTLLGLLRATAHYSPYFSGVLCTASHTSARYRIFAISCTICFYGLIGGAWGGTVFGSGIMKEGAGSMAFGTAGDTAG